MSFALSSGTFSAIEQEFSRTFLETLKKRQDPLREQHLIVVPSAAVRKHLLRVLFNSGCGSFTAVRLVTLNGLAQEILMDSLQEPYSLVDDPIYFVLALQSTARKLGLKQFQAYRTARGLLNTIRDLVDGLLTPELFEQFLEAEPRGDLRSLFRLYQAFLETLDKQKILNVQYASSLAIVHAASWLSERNVQALHVYGFYDATPAQFELLETMVRQVHSGDHHVRIYFPFAVTNTVEHPAEYAQEFFDTLQSLAVKLGGNVEHCTSEKKGASNDVEAFFFRGSFEGAVPALQVFSAGSPYDEAWTVSKKILQLILNGVRLDQVAVITRSLESCKATLQHVFDENQIPHSLPSDERLCGSTSGHFVYLLLLMRQSYMNHNLVFELLCSPLLKDPFSPAGLIRDLLEILFITNSDDWHRLKPIADLEKKLPEIFELSENDPKVEQYRRAATYLVQLKQRIDRIPLQATLPDFSEALWNLVQEIAEPDRFGEAGGLQLQLLLERMGDLPLENEYTLNEFVEIFKDDLANTMAGTEACPADAQVTIGDIMSLRGVTFDHVFVTGLNQDVWPLRTTEDPFLPDSLRRIIRETTGAGPHPKRRFEMSDEDLLLFTLALRAANQKLYLSYQRADSDGRKKSPSIYIEETRRLLGLEAEHFPRHLEQRLTSQFLPAPHEFSTLIRRFSPDDLAKQFYDLPANYIPHTIAFAEKLNSIDRDAAAPVDGMIEDSSELWKSLFDGKLRFSYSRVKDYVRCGFSFYCDRILKLQPSPFKPMEIPHDLTPLVRGKIAESVVKDAVLKLRPGKISIEEAVKSAEAKTSRKYSPYLPKVLIDYYLSQFSRAARVMLKYLQAEGYEFSLAETPERGYDCEIKLLEEPSGILNIYGIPDLLLFGRKKLIVEMKWGSPATSDTADAMFNKGELQFCFYPELERQKRELLEPVDFRYFRLNVYGELGSPLDLEQKLRALKSPTNIDKTMRIFGSSPLQKDIESNFLKLKEFGKNLLNGEFKILEDPSDFFSPCTNCAFILTCRRTHSATLLRAKKQAGLEIIPPLEQEGT